jgi:hypothetical protein
MVLVRLHRFGLGGRGTDEQGRARASYATLHLGAEFRRRHPREAVRRDARGAPQSLRQLLDAAGALMLRVRDAETARGGGMMRRSAHLHGWDLDPCSEFATASHFPRRGTRVMQRSQPPLPPSCDKAGQLCGHAPFLSNIISCVRAQECVAGDTRTFAAGAAGEMDLPSFKDTP